MATTKRTRCRKVHVWMHPTILQSFETIRIRLGFSRDGGFERALVEFIKTHKDDPDATTTLAAHRG